MDLRETILNQTDASFSIAKQLMSTEAKGANVVFSPLSIHVVLGQILSGSSGPALDQLLDFLRAMSTEALNSFTSQLVAMLFADGAPLGGPRLTFANGLWVDQSLSLRPSFEDIVRRVYRAVSIHVDFQHKSAGVTKEVNTWADKETDSLIQEILPSGSVDASTRLIFTNAVYFKGAWNEKFDESATQDHEFFLLDGSSVQAPFMTSEKKQYILAFDGFKVLGLPYKQGRDKRRFSMYFFLPDANDGLPDLIEKGLGLDHPFSGDGLNEMVDSPLSQNLYVSSIYHKSFIEVNEEGTEAAAASAAVVKLRALQVDDKLDFVADHPFLFLIREDMTGVVLFIGQVLNPVDA
ncbi:UNVERIFIED_CONTAM: Serpin-ZX [Sesamum calycinum]|uniref:Serpin-ZX n=1 Tax=Sesamum calycinum TaxID=2727403 RepID=A0AAW2P7P0_9LAMI